MGYLPRLANWLPSVLERKPEFFSSVLRGAQEYVIEQIEAREERLRTMRDAAAAIRHFRGMVEIRGK